MNNNSKKSAVKRMTFKLAMGKDVKYTKEDLVDTLESIPFNLININLSIKKSHIGMNGVGYNSIGYVNGFDKETGEFDVVVFNNKSDAVVALNECVITVRAFTDKENKISKIISLDLEPVETVK